MEELVNILKELNPEVLFIVVLSSVLNKYVKYARIKFLIPTALAFVAALAYAEPMAWRSVLKTWMNYTGQGTIMYEVYKNTLGKNINKNKTGE